MPVAAATYGLTNFNTAAGASQYKAQIDADFSVLTRLADIFAPHQGSTADMRVYLDPGFILSGTSLTELGTYTTATFSSASTSATVASATGISGTMWITGAGIPNGTTCTISGTTLTLSQATTAAGTAAPVVLGQRTAAIVAPVTNPRIDRVVVSGSTGAVSIIAGAEAATPSAPALTAGVLPVAQVLLQTSSTSILNTMITDERAIGSGSGVNNTEATVASAGTTDIGATNVNTVLITGVTTITSFGSNGNTTNPIYRVRWNNALTLTNNNTSLILPGANNIVTIAGDNAVFQYLGSGNWKCLEYTRFSGANITTGLAATIASATTTDLGTKGVNILTISGITTITGFGSTATTDNPLYFITFSGALTLTYNATSLKLPGTASITTAANDTCLAQYLGSGNWQVMIYSKATGAPVIGSNNVPRTVQTSTYAPTITDNASEISFAGAGADATWTIAAGATNGAGWWCYFNNPTTHYLTVKVTTNNIDGISGATGYIMYPGEVRLVQCDGTNYFTTVMHGFILQVDVAASPYTFFVPPGYQSFDSEATGAGGGGGANATAGGGGGGGYNRKVISAASMGSTTQTITIGAGAIGTTGGNTTIGSLLTGYGGGPSANSAGSGGGGGGGLTSAGLVSVTTTGGNGGGPSGATTSGITGAGGATTLTGVDNLGGGGGNGGTATGLAGASLSGNGGGGGAGGGAAGTGGSSINGGGGGASATGTAGTSVNGGSGGATTVAGSVPGGGGGRNAAGGAGRAIIKGII